MAGRAGATPVPGNCLQRLVGVRRDPTKNTGALSLRDPLQTAGLVCKGRVCVLQQKKEKGIESLLAGEKPSSFLSGAADAHWQRSKPNKVTACLVVLSDLLKCFKWGCRVSEEDFNFF